MKLKWPALLGLLFACSPISAKEACVPKYNTSSNRIPGKTNIHLMPHTHDDSGWLKTLDQYYYGARQDIQIAGVQYVLDTVMYALARNPDRRFSYAEMSFFTMWWDEQTKDVQEGVRKLVADGQLNFINGGWVQHDEAAAHYVAMIDQTTRGHRFLEETFGYRPTVGWQIDPFGHSSTHASLMAGYLGFDGLFFGRSDYQDLELRKKAQQLEFLWRGARSFGKEADIFTGSFPTGNYGPPGGFYFDWGNFDPPVQDNTCLTELNVEDRVNDFVKAAEEYADLYQDKDIFWPMGTDFTYSNAFSWYKNLDKLIHYVNLDGRVNTFYSTPADYVKLKHSFNETWPLKTDDFFPYADCETCYWTGYFTSRPASKGYIKAATSYLQVVRQLELLTGTRGTASDGLEEAVSLLQHHDSITGTEKQHVANDYHKRLAKGWLQASTWVSTTLAAHVYNRTQQAGTTGSNRVLNLQQCPDLNVSACEISVSSSQKNDNFIVVAYNSLAWHRTAPIRVPIEADEEIAWQVSGPDGNDIEAQIVPISDTTRTVQKVLTKHGALPKIHHQATGELAFVADLPPLGYSTYRINKRRSSSAANDQASTVKNWTPKTGSTSTAADTEELFTFSKGGLELELSARTGNIVSFTDRHGKKKPLDIQGAWYRSHDDKGGVASGAYIFRPDGQQNSTVLETVTVDGSILTEVHLALLDFLHVTVRLWKGLDHVELEWTAGPIPIDDNTGKEVIIKYQSDVKSGSEFFTDSNGREMLQRKLNYRPTWDLKVVQPVAGNYYPLTAAISVADDETELSVLVDRAQGGSSLTPGGVEVMLHRRTLLDDIRGVNEPLNETVATCRFCDSPGLIARGTHYLSLDSSKDAAAHRRHLQQLINDPVLLSFGPAVDTPSDAPTSFSAMPAASTGLPKNVQLLTTKMLGDGKLLLRLAHLFQVDEKAGDLSKSVTVDLNSLFESFKFESVHEYGLAGAQPLDQIERLRFKAGDPIHNGGIESSLDYRKSSTFSCKAGCSSHVLNVTIQPMEIRTFVAKLEGSISHKYSKMHDVESSS